MRSAFSGSSSSPGQTSLRFGLLLLLLAIATAAGFSSIPPSTVQAEPVDVTEGSLQWGIRASFRAYVGGGTVSDGAALVDPENPTSSIIWPLTAGSFDPATNTTTMQFGGSVHYQKYCDEGGPCQLDFKLSNPRITISPDGARLNADVVSRNFYGDGQMAEYPNVLFAALAYDAEAFSESAGVVTWTELTSSLTAAAYDAFAGFYPVGAPLDLLAFSYTGPGGIPVASVEELSNPGIPAFAAQDVALPSFPYTNDMFFDRQNNLIVAAHSLGLQAYSPDDWSLVANLDVSIGSSAPFWVPRMFANAGFIPASSTVLVVYSNAGTDIMYAFTWNSMTQTWAQATVPGAFTNTETSRIFGHPVDDVGFYTNGNQIHRIQRQGDGSFSVKTFTAPGVNTVVAVTADDTFIGYLSIGGLATIHITDDETPVVTVTPIADTQSLLPFSSNQARAQGAVGPDGSVSVITQNANRVVTVAPNAGTWTVQGSATVTAPSTLAVDPVDGTVYVAEGNVGKVAVVRGSEVAQRLDASWHYYVNLMVDSKRSLHFTGMHSQQYTGYVRTFHRLGSTPQITLQPQSQVVPLSGGAGTVTFSAEATGVPMPSVQWQSRPAHSTNWQDWSDVAGATTTTLTIEVHILDNLKQYRAVFTNETADPSGPGIVQVGRVASNPAVIAVGEGTAQTITTTIGSTGGLSISVGSTQVALPTPVLNGAGDALVSSGALNPVTVTDQRSANPGWNLNGQVSAFTSTDNSFGGEHLGWTPEVVSQSGSQNVSAGVAVAPGGSLSTGAGLASAPAGAGVGTAVVGAGLELSVPTTTAPGDYSAILTLTVI